MALTVAGKPLTPPESSALRYLMHHKGRPVSWGELIERVCGGDQEPNSNALEVLVGRLRKKIGSEMIVTQRG